MHVQGLDAHLTGRGRGARLYCIRRAPSVPHGAWVCPVRCASNACGGCTHAAPGCRCYSMSPPLPHACGILVYLASALLVHVQ
jgi:hypothetical protein